MAVDEVVSADESSSFVAEFGLGADASVGESAGESAGESTGESAGAGAGAGALTSVGFAVVGADVKKSVYF